MRRRSFLSAASATALLATTRAADAAPPPVTIGIMGGEIDGTFMRVATDLTSVLNSDKLRVIPVVGKGSLQNMGDLLRLPGIDLALIAADVLDYARHTNLYPGELEKIAYICKLYDNDLHVCARPEITSLADLNGKPVNIDVEGAGTNLTARAVFQACGVSPIFRTEEPTIGQSRLQKGEIAANVYCAGRPVRLFVNTPAGTNLHFIPVPMNATLAQTYLPSGQLTATDYPNLVPAGQEIETVGVGVTLACFNWPMSAQRYRNLVLFVDTFFEKFPELLTPPHHPAWRHVNLAAAQPGWTRFKPAADWLARRQAEASANVTDRDPDRAAFNAFLAKNGGARMTPAEREATWQYFRQFARTQQSAAR